MTDLVQSEALSMASDAQAKAANPNASAFATANAGSGKTKVLIDRVARLLLQRPDGRPGAKPDSILCITYTRAAASEMLTRLFKTLGDWAVMEDARLRLTLSKLEQTEPEKYSQDQLKAARALFARALETPGGLRIETIHAFCARILRRFPLEAGVVPGFVELEDEDAREMWQRAKRTAILDAAADDPVSLALIAREAGREGASSALDTVRIAGGTLRAFVSAHGPSLAGIEQALRNVIKPPSRPAADIIERAMRADFPLARVQQAIGALDGGATTDLKLAEQLRDVLGSPDLRSAFNRYTDVFLTAKGEARKRSPFTAAVGKKHPVLPELFAMGDDPGAETLRMEIVISDLKHAEAFERTLALLKIGLPALEAYADEKARRGALDFDDLIERTRDLLQTDGLASWVLFKLDGGLSHLLLDEAQDTSPAQWDLIRALTQEFNAGAGAEQLQEPRTTFMVGDEKQSIYSFQGADPARFLSETQALTLRDPNAAQADMRMSFRSSPEILNFVDTVWNSAPVIDTPDAPSPPMTANEIVHTAKRWNEPGFVEIWPVVPKDPAAETDAWERPVDALRITAPKVKLAREIAGSIKQMVSGGASVWAEGGCSGLHNRVMCSS